MSEKPLLPLSQNEAHILRSDSIASPLFPTSQARRTSTLSVASSQHDVLLNPRFAVSDSAWADGLRGIAAVFVMCSHIVLTLDTSLVNPCCGPDEKMPKLFQRPILRLIAQGQTWVSIFILLSGFVNALKPIRQARNGDTQTALSNIALSSFRRSFRLVLPATAATFVSWTFEQLSFYYYARHGAAYWISQTVPPVIPSLNGRVLDLFTQVIATWSVNDENHYDQPQWALVHLLMGSMFVFMSLVITLQLKPIWRALSLGLLYYASAGWSHKFGDPLVGMNTFAGMLLAELFIVTKHDSASFWVKMMNTILTPPAFLVSLVLMSVPMDNWASASWSNSIMTVVLGTMPLQREPPRGVMSLGGQMLIFCIIMSPLLRRILSTRPLLWLGKVSFGVYLLHGPLLRSVFAWCLYVGSTPVIVPLTGSSHGETVLQYPLPRARRIAVSLALYLPVVAIASHVWTLKMEPIFARITKRCEELMFQKKMEAPRLNDFAANKEQRRASGKF